MELVERVARAIRDVKGGLNYDYMDFCRDAAKAAIAAMQPEPAGSEPVAWMYHMPGDLEHGWQRFEFKRRIQAYEGMSCNEEDAGMIETPLYTHPADARAEVERAVVAWLRESAAWHDKHDDGLSGFDGIRQGLTEAADAIEAGEHRT